MHMLLLLTHTKGGLWRSFHLLRESSSTLLFDVAFTFAYTCCNR